MKHVIVQDQNGFVNRLKKYLPGDIEIIPLESLVDSLANNIRRKVGQDQNKVIIINAEMQTGGNCKRSNYDGIKLLKALRIQRKLLNPILIYGFSDLASILQKHPQHLILTAVGVKYLQLPISPTEVNVAVEKLQPISAKELKDGYKAAAMADFEILDISHSFSNEYGLELMYRAHEGVTGHKLSLPQESIERLKPLMSKSDFLYRYSADQNIKDECKPLRKMVAKVLSAMGGKKIACLDDQGEGGWFVFYSHLLYYEISSPSFAGITPSKDPKQEPDLNTTIENTIQIITRQQPDIFLLDLRLFGEKEKGYQIEDISGYKVLQKIKEKFPELPVIITSATNKSDNLTALLKAGAFGLWSKPRIEQGDIDIYEKYHNLLRIVHDALIYFRHPEEKIPIKADYLISGIEEPADSVKQFLSKYDAIITDTNCWMMGPHDDKKIEDIAQLYKNLVLTSRIVGKEVFFVVIDVIRELSDHLYKLADVDSIERKVKNSIMANYGMRKLNKIIIDQQIWVYDRHITNAEEANVLSFEYEEDGIRIKEYCSKIVDLLNKRVLDSRDYALIDNYDDRKKTLRKLRARRNVDGDPAFLNLIYYMLTRKKPKLPNKKHKDYYRRNILFLSEDSVCKDNIHHWIKNTLGFQKSEEVNTKTKNGIEKIIGGIFSGYDYGADPFILTIMDPFDFSKKLNNLQNSNTP